MRRLLATLPFLFSLFSAQGVLANEPSCVCFDIYPMFNDSYLDRNCQIKEAKLPLSEPECTELKVQTFFYQSIKLRGECVQTDGRSPYYCYWKEPQENQK